LPEASVPESKRGRINLILAGLTTVEQLLKTLHFAVLIVRKRVAYVKVEGPEIFTRVAGSLIGETEPFI
jgi:hypothetical protein